MVVSSFEGLYINSGIGTFYSALADFLSTRGHSVTVLYTRDHSETHTFQYWQDHYRERGIELVALPASLLNAQINAPYFLRKSYDVYKYLQNRNFDLVHFPGMRIIRTPPHFY